MILLGDVNVTIDDIDCTLPFDDWAADWLSAPAIPTTTPGERLSWASDVVGDMFVDTFRWLFP